jgi:hypothetical protein
MEMRTIWRTASQAVRQTPARNRLPIRHASSTPTTGSKPLKVDIPAAKPKAAENPKAGNWPWRTVESDPVTGKVTEERLIYSRPPSFRPKMLWFVIGESRRRGVFEGRRLTGVS